MSDKITVQAMDSSKKNSAVTGPVTEEATVMMNAAAKFCIWNDQQFDEGQVVACDGVSYECSLGKWVQTG